MRQNHRYVKWATTVNSPGQNGKANGNWRFQSRPVCTSHQPGGEHHPKDSNNGHSERNNPLRRSLAHPRVGSQATSPQRAGLYQKQTPGVMPRIGQQIHDELMVMNQVAVQTSKTGVNAPTVEWKTLPWRQLEAKVFKLQTRIYRAEQNDDVKTVHKLQKTLMRSWAARCLAVRKVTQDNRGKQTAGIDGIKSLPPAQRLQLAQNLSLSDKSAPVRRVLIPKPGKPEKRPLGIPTLTERARQALVKLALEPQWEAKFEPHSYGFRPGRSAQDALRAIQQATQQKAKYVLDADIAKCFDQIDQSKLLDKLDTFPSLRRQIKAWLKAGVIDGAHWFPTECGTPQGGVISPLLANIALHGMESYLKQQYPRHHRTIDGKCHDILTPKLVRYADDLVVLHEDLSVIQGCRGALTTWLQDMGLVLHPEKTRITHTLTPVEGNVGFDFLGYHFQQHPVGQHRASHVMQGNYLSGATRRSLGFKLFVTPSQDSLKRHMAAVGEIIKQHSHAPQAALIHALNPVIRGWATYFGYFNARSQLAKADFLTYQKLRAWAVNRCTGRGAHKVAEKYWQIRTKGHWTFAADDVVLTRHIRYRTAVYKSLRNQKSPYDGDWAYWSQRLGRYPGIPHRVAKLLQKQAGKCAFCGLHITFHDLIEVDHIQPRSLGGQETFNNLQLLHGHCHDLKTATDGSCSAFFAPSQFIEEPDEGKLSRPVLKESSSEQFDVRL